MLHIYALILFLASLLKTGYAVYFENHAIQIPLIHLINNPSLYPNDPFAATLTHYSSRLWWIVALLQQFIPLETLLFGLFLITRLLVIYAAAYLAQAFAPKSRLAAIGAMGLVSFISPIIGHGTLVGVYFEQTGLSVCCFILATAFFYKNQPILCAICLAIGFDLNSLYGLYTLTYLGAAIGFTDTLKKYWKQWLLSFAVFLLVALPGIMFTASSFGRNTTDTSLWLAACRLFSPFHFYPHTANVTDISMFIVLLLGVLAVLLLYGNTKFQSSEKINNQATHPPQKLGFYASFHAFYQNWQQMEKLTQYGLIWTGVGLSWVIYAFIAAYVIQSPAMLVMHPLRGTDLWYLLSGIILISVSAVKLESSGTSTEKVSALVIFLLTIAWGSLKTMGLFTGIVAVAIFKPNQFLNTQKLAVLVTLLIFLSGGTSFQRRFLRDGTVKAALIQQPSTDIQQVADWAIANTATDAEFLIDPTFISQWNQFRGLAQRPVFVTWRDGAAVLWERDYVRSWAERLQALGIDITQAGLDHAEATAQISERYKQLGDEDVKQLQTRFPLDYWVVSRDKASKFPSQFQNQAYKVLKLN